MCYHTIGIQYDMHGRNPETDTCGDHVQGGGNHPGQPWGSARGGGQSGGKGEPGGGLHYRGNYLGGLKREEPTRARPEGKGWRKLTGARAVQGEPERGLGECWVLHYLGAQRCRWVEAL